MIVFSTLALVYGVSVGTTISYSVKVDFEGYIPIFGGKEGKASANMIVNTSGLPPKDGLACAETEVTEMRAEAFGSVLPLNKNNVSQFFPKSEATFKGNGVVVTNSAPEIKMPVRLPGLDSRRLPEISFLPIQLPERDAKVGHVYEFTREFSGLPVKYVVTTKAVDEKEVRFDIELSQTASGFEDAYGNPAEEKNAKRKLESVLSGSGKAVFNRGLSRFDSVLVTSETKTKVTPISKGKESNRSLKLTLKITRDGLKEPQ